MVRNRKQNIVKNIFVYSMLAYPLLQWFIWYFCKNITSVTMAFQTVEGGELVFAGFSNFVKVIESFKGDPLFITSFKNSIILFVVSFVVSVPLYMLFAYYIFKDAFGSKTLRFLIMLPSIVSGIIMTLIFKRVITDVIPMFFIEENPDFPNLLRDGRYAFWVNLVFSIWLSFSTNILIYPNAMRTISEEVIESARLDGVNIFQELWYIILPHIFPTFTTFVVTNTAGIFATSGSLLTFYYYDAPPEAYNMGYYLLVKVMKTSNEAQKCFAAAAGLILTFVTAPLTMFVRWAMEKYGPSED